MKKFIKYFVLLLALISLCSLSACKDDNVKVVSIEVVKDSVPEYIYVDEIDQKITSIKINVIKSDDSSEKINITKEMVSSSDYENLKNEGTYTITVTYEECETILQITTKKKDDKPIVDPQNLDYSIKVKDIAGKPLADFYVTFYLGDDIVDEGYTKTDGTFTTSQKPNKYDVVVEGREGYYLNQEMYQTDLLATPIEVVCELDSLEGIIAEKGHLYQVGDLMYDFTLTDTDNNKLKLYELLKEYKVVILNFWFSTCAYCQYEFPAMVNAYESSYTNTNNETVNYKDEVAIIAVNPMIAGNGDTLASITNYKEANGITFFVAADYDCDPTNLTMEPGLTLMFGVTNYPTTVIIDSYGLIAQIEKGAQTATEKWTQTFDRYVAEDYFPAYTGQVSEGGTYQKPDITQEESSKLEQAASGTNYDGSKFSTEYRPEYNEEDKDFSWPWVVTNYQGKDCIKPSNQDKHPSYSIVYVNVTLKAGEGFAFDYYASSEEYDFLYVTFDKTIVAQISGQSSAWDTCYSYVANEDGSFEVGFCYMKDSSYNGGDDSIYVTNLRIIKKEDIDKETYIFRECAIGQHNELTMAYPKYAQVVYNEVDGYYHVNTKNGPLLLADMLSGTKWSNSDLYTISLEGLCIGLDGIDYTDIVEKYSVYAHNSTVGYAPVTEELANALKQIAKALGHENARDNINQWLELCVYYDAYGTNGVELGVPTIGVCYFEPIMLEGDGINSPAQASGVFDRVILPRGLIFGFTASKSGAYKFYSTGEIETAAWICDNEGVAVDEQETELRKYFIQMSNGENLDPNFECYVYLEEGKTYLFRAGFYDPTLYDTINVAISYVGERIELFTLASPGYFTSSDGEMSDIISGNHINVMLGEDGYYHVINSNASDDFVYCDVEYMVGFLGVSLSVLASERYDGFNFNKDSYGQMIYDEEDYFRMTILDEENNIHRYYVCVDKEGNEYYVEQVGEGEYTEENGYTYVKRPEGNINYDFTQYVLEYIENNKITDEASELYGCVKVDKKFADVLWLIINKYLFAGIEESWLKLCYYYKYVGPVNK